MVASLLGALGERPHVVLEAAAFDDLRQQRVDLARRQRDHLHRSRGKPGRAQCAQKKRLSKATRTGDQIWNQRSTMRPENGTSQTDSAATPHPAAEHRVFKEAHCIGGNSSYRVVWVRCMLEYPPLLSPGQATTGVRARCSSSRAGTKAGPRRRGPDLVDAVGWHTWAPRADGDHLEVAGLELARCDTLQRCQGNLRSTRNLGLSAAWAVPDPQTFRHSL